MIGIDLPYQPLATELRNETDHAGGDAIEAHISRELERVILATEVEQLRV